MIKLFTKKRKGFTLIELIVVIAILGILMALAIPRFSGFTDKAKISADEQYASIVANALLIEYASGGVVAGTYEIDSEGNVELTAEDEDGNPIEGTAKDVSDLVELTSLQYYDSAEIVITAGGDKTITMIKDETETEL